MGLWDIETCGDRTWPVKALNYNSQKLLWAGYPLGREGLSQ